ncbi:MAG: hypothetical protein ABH851_04290 [Methanobacteriota archaeon]
MTVVNFRITKIDGEKKDKTVTSVTANASSMITKMEIKKDDNAGEYLLVSYRYTVKYEPDIGYILLEGSLWYFNKELKKVVTKKDKEVSVEREVMEEVSTAILREAMLESVSISRKLQLPPPMQLPKVEVKPKNSKAA